MASLDLDEFSDKYTCYYWSMEHLAWGYMFHFSSLSTGVAWGIAFSGEMEILGWVQSQRHFAFVSSRKRKKVLWFMMTIGNGIN